MSRGRSVRAGTLTSLDRGARGLCFRLGCWRERCASCHAANPLKAPLLCQECPKDIYFPDDAQTEPGPRVTTLEGNVDHAEEDLTGIALDKLVEQLQDVDLILIDEISTVGAAQFEIMHRRTYLCKIKIPTSLALRYFSMMSQHTRLPPDTVFQCECAESRAKR